MYAPHDATGGYFEIRTKTPQNNDTEVANEPQGVEINQPEQVYCGKHLSRTGEQETGRGFKSKGRGKRRVRACVSVRSSGWYAA